MTSTPILSADLVPGDVLLWDGLRIKVRSVQDFGDSVHIKGTDLGSRRVWGLIHNTITVPVEVER